MFVRLGVEGQFNIRQFAGIELYGDVEADLTLADIVDGGLVGLDRETSRSMKAESRLVMAALDWGVSLVKTALKTPS
jgi:hypothetical protein